MSKRFMIGILSLGIFALLGAGTQQNGNATFAVAADDKIILQEDDNFQLKVRNNMNNEEQVITVSALDVQNVNTLSFPIASYTVEDIVYQGSNGTIEPSGYGVISSFDVTADGTTIPIAVGSEEVKDLFYTYRDVIGKQDGTFLTSQDILNNQIDAEEQDINESSGAVSEETADGLDTEAATPEVQEPEIPDTETQNTEETVSDASAQNDTNDQDEFQIKDVFAFTRGRNYPAAVLSLLSIAVVASAVLYYFYKKKV